MDMLVNEVGLDNLIFEVPQKRQQTNLIKKYEKSVNIGNVKPEDVLSVASLRCGLRSDTLGAISHSYTTFRADQIRSHLHTSVP